MKIGNIKQSHHNIKIVVKIFDKMVQMGINGNPHYQLTLGDETGRKLTFIRPDKDAESQFEAIELEAVFFINI